MARRPVDPVDTIWLNMDRADNLMVIESLMMLDGPVDWDRFKATVEHRILDRFPVFRQRPVPSRLPMVAPHWEDDPDFKDADTGDHFLLVIGVPPRLLPAAPSHLTCRPFKKFSGQPLDVRNSS